MAKEKTICSDCMNHDKGDRCTTVYKWEGEGKKEKLTPVPASEVRISETECSKWHKKDSWIFRVLGM